MSGNRGFNNFGQQVQRQIQTTKTGLTRETVRIINNVPTNGGVMRSVQTHTESYSARNGGTVTKTDTATTYFIPSGGRGNKSQSIGGGSSRAITDGKRW